MDYSIQAEVERRAQNLATAKAVAAAYPDAQVCWLDEKQCVFVSQSVKPDRVDFLTDDVNVVNFAAYAKVTNPVFCGGELRVYLGNGYGEVLRTYFSDASLSSDVRATLIALVKS
mgnify:CR=1 FL=1